MRAALFAHPGTVLPRCVEACPVACANGHADVVKALLKAGCSTSMLNDSGRTGWDLAQEMGRTNVTELLSKLATKGSKKLSAEARVKELEAQYEALGGVTRVIG